MALKIYAQVEIKDVKTGKLIKRTRKRVCKSYVRALIDILGGIMQTGTGSSGTPYIAVTPKRIDGTSGSLNINTDLNVQAAASNDLFGILVGTGEDAITISDFKLKTQIAHGITSTKLSYGAVSVGAVGLVGSTVSFTLARTFTNLSGADIAVKEVGLAVNPNGYNIYILLEHSLLAFTITNGTSGTVTYTISATV